MSSSNLFARTALYLRKKSNFVLLLGSLIVFASFIVRDELREDLKDITSTIASAQISFEMRNDAAIIFSDLTGIQSTLTRAMIQTSGRSDLLASDQAELIRIQAQNSIINLQASALSSLIDQIPENGAFIKRMDSLKERLYAEVDQVADASNRVNGALKDRGSFSSTSPGQQDIHDKYVIPVEGTSVPLQIELGNIETDATARARGVQVQRERVYNIVNWISIALFCLGWIFGILTKLVGVDVGR